MGEGLYRECTVTYLVSTVGVCRPRGAGKGGTSYSLGTRCNAGFELPVTEKIVPVKLRRKKSPMLKASQNAAKLVAINNARRKEKRKQLTHSEFSERD